MVKKNLFELAKENAKIKECDGCHEVKPLSSFKKGNKYCTGCKFVDEIREKYRNKLDSTISIQDIEDIDLDSFFDNL